MKTVNYFKKYSILALLATGMFFTSCKEDDVVVPEEENEEEVITDVKLIFTSADGVVEASAKDPDGEGVLELVISDEITLDANTEYTLTFEIMNNLETPGEDIGEEIAEEDDEHQLFFGFSEDAFSDPTGTGNIDGSSDINYNDEDDNGYPVGLSTTWTTSASSLEDGEFTVRLQHQPDSKTSTSGATDGDTDFELTFVLNIEADDTPAEEETDVKEASQEKELEAEKVVGAVEMAN